MKNIPAQYLLYSMLFWMTISPQLYGQQIISRQILWSDQLSATESTEIYQDREGFIWIGTYNGILRYDGYGIRIFKNNYQTPSLLTSNTISCFTENDEHLWVGSNKGINLIDKKTLRITTLDKPEIANVNIRCLLTDSKGAVWIGAATGLFRYSAEQIERKKPSYAGDFYTNSIYEDHQGNIWVLSWQGGLHRYNPATDDFEAFPQIGWNNNPFRIYQDREGRYWIGTWGNGLWRFNPQAAPADMYIQQPAIHSSWQDTEGIIYDIIQDDTYGYLWALSYSGLLTFRVGSDDRLEEIQITDFDNQPGGLERVRSYTRIIKDRDKNLWLNSYDRACTIFFSHEKISNHTLPGMEGDIGLSPNITSLGKDNSDVIWFNQNWYGLCLYDPVSTRLAYGKRMNMGMNVSHIIPSRTNDAVWISDAYTRLIWKMKQQDMRPSILEEINLEHTMPYPGVVTRLAEDRQGNLWIGTDNHLFVKQPGGEPKAVRVEGIGHVTDIIEDHDGNIWISGQKDIRQVAQDSIFRPVRQYSQPLISSEDHIEALCTDTEGNIWFATSFGRVSKINRKTSQITDISDSCSLNGERILRLLAQDDDIWIVQSKRIVRHTPSGNNHLYYITDDNIYLSSFRFGKAFVDGGKLYAAGTEGYITIEPTDDLFQADDHKVLITDVFMDSHSVLAAPDANDTPASIEEITFPADARNIEIHFSSLNYPFTGRVEYAYKLEGEDNQWTYLNNGKHTAYFNRLGKGSYTFLVKSRASGSEWSGEITRLRIVRLPALYETWYAQLLYVLAGLLLLLILLHFYLKRINKKNKIRFQEELTQAKLNYFTNISHELLTPLTVISCIANDMEENPGNTTRQVDILRINVGRLKRLLMQILDFRKVESNNMPLRVAIGDVSTFISGVTASNFEYLAQQKNIRFNTRVANDIWGYIDFEKLDKMLFNLLSNAIKYTPENKKVELSAYIATDEGVRTLIVEVDDEGIGINAKDIPNIFNKFYNNKQQVGYESNGIGLSLTKDLIELHHGTIHVVSEPGKGSAFTIRLPLDESAYDEQEIIASEASQTLPAESEASDNKPCILYIDDNHDLRELMKSMLRHKYQILLAENGRQGLETLNPNTVDVIICDWMMPQMNGLEFCKRVKENVQTSHIPILMLTAKTSPKDQVECYRAGVESFITKPFDKNILEARIANLLHMREARQQKFRTNMDINISNLEYQSADELFLNDAIVCIENHLDNPDFDIPKLADLLHVSKSTLNRKLKVITNLTPVDFIRNIRLKHACYLLKNKSVTISEVAYATGFNNPKYFSKCFKDEFGITPSEFMEEAQAQS